MRRSVRPGDPYRTGAPEPPEPVRAAPARSELGALRLQARPRLTRDEWIWIGVVAAIACSLAVGTKTLAAFAMVPLLAGPLLSYFLFKRAREMRLHQHGMVVVRWVGKAVTVLFDDVTSVIDVVREGEATITLVDKHGHAVWAGRSHVDTRPIFDALYRRCVAPVREEALLAVQAGETLHFGSITVSNASLRIHDWDLGLDDVISVQIGAADIKVIAADDKWESAPLAAVPYPFVLATVLQHVGAPVTLARGIELVRPSSSG
jgi:hypothetical protein